MIPNPILKVLSTLSCHEVRHLLMGGQACVFYGGAEFSRDCDITFVADTDNLARLSAALVELKAECIAIPAFEVEYLLRGHAVHFRCHHREAENIRLDIMTTMRGCDEFERLWERRTTIRDDLGNVFELLSIEDLIQAKKTQRDKDWPMIRRLVEAHFDQFQDFPTPDIIAFWLRETRTSSLLSKVARSYPEAIPDVCSFRPFLREIDLSDQAEIERHLALEEANERAQDIEYWRPLKAELEGLRQIRRQEKKRDV